MSKPIYVDGAVQRYMSELTSRIVSKTGITSDKFHLGKIILHSIKETDPEMIMQIDGGTGESENYGSVLKRSVKCANALRYIGIKKGDVMVLMAPNHLDLAIPFYAALYLGIIIAPVDQYLGVGELIHTFSIYEPKIIFCQNDRVPYVKQALENIGSQSKIITFDNGDTECSFLNFLEEFGNGASVDEFRPTDFDPENTIGFIIPTSGTTGPPKGSVATHKNYAVTVPNIWAGFTQFPTPTRMILIVAPLQWLSAYIHFIGAPYFKFQRLQSSLPITQEHGRYLINTYKPSLMALSPTMMATLIKPEDGMTCDFTCFDIICLSGSAVLKDLIEEVKMLTPKTRVVDIYAISEANCVVFQNYNTPKGACKKRINLFQYRLMDIETGKEIEEPHISGELWLKGPEIFKGYYNNPEVTKDAIVDGWFKTGDIFYRDENWNYYFVERIKLLLKYKNHQISPVEVESVIRKHPSVLDVAVTSVPDRECGDLPVACVVRRPGHALTAQEIKDLVKDSLTDTKQLRGGVIFMPELPATATTKIHRQKLKELVLTMERE